MVKPSDIV